MLDTFDTYLKLAALVEVCSSTTHMFNWESVCQDVLDAPFIQYYGSQTDIDNNFTGWINSHGNIRDS